MSRSPRTGGGLAVEGGRISACSEVTPVSAHLVGFFFFDVHVEDGEFTDDTIPLEFGEEAGEVAKAGEDMGP